jgi:hypothetical protein
MFETRGVNIRASHKLSSIADAEKSVSLSPDSKFGQIIHPSKIELFNKKTN